MQPQNKITGQSRQILFEWLPPQTQDLHGFFIGPDDLLLRSQCEAILALSYWRCCIGKFSQCSTVSEGDLAEFFFSISKIGGDDWDVSYSSDSRSIKITSVGKIKGSDFGGGLPANNLADYPITICFRITSEPTEERIQSLEALTQKKSEFVDGMSENVLGWYGYSKLRPRSLSKKEWAEYLEYAELEHQVELLALPTHIFRSLYLVDVSQWHIRPASDQLDTGEKILAQRDEMLKLVTQVKRVPIAPPRAR